MKISAKVFARVGGEVIRQYTLANDNGMTLRFLTFGARVQQLRLPHPQAAGGDPNLLIGFVTLEDYLEQPGGFGATLGPLGGPGAEPNRAGWQNWNWQAETAQGPDNVSITFSLLLNAGADGLPGARSITVKHTLTATNEWRTTMTVETTSQVTIHPVINNAFILTGDPAQTILDEQLTLNGEKTAVPVIQLATPAQTLALEDRCWQLTATTDGPGFYLDPLENINAENNFNGILGHAHVALGIRPLAAENDAAVTIGLGHPYSRTTSLKLTTIKPASAAAVDKKAGEAS